MRRPNIFIVGLCFQFFLYANSAFSEEKSVSSHSEARGADFHYEIVLNKSPKLCGVLNEIFNSSLKRVVNSGSPLIFTHPEIENPRLFKKFGLNEPRNLVSDRPGVMLYRVDLFEEGAPRDIMIVDITSQRRIVSRQEILRRGAQGLPDPAAILSRLTQSPEIPSDLDIDAASFSGVARDFFKKTHQEPLAEWPGFDASVTQYFAGKKIMVPALADNPVIRRVFIYEGRPVFLENSYVGEKPSYADRSVVVAYQALPSGRNDICYVVLAPTVLTKNISDKGLTLGTP